MLVVRGVSYVRFSRSILRRSRPAPKEAQAVYGVLTASDRRPPKLVCSPEAATPMLMGLVRPVLVLPCRDQTRGWKEADVRRYREILSRADKVVYTAEHYSPGCMHRRNRHLMDNSSVCVAYCTRQTGGSAYTAQYARQRGLRLVMLGEERQAPLAPAAHLSYNEEERTAPRGGPKRRQP